MPPEMKSVHDGLIQRYLKSCGKHAVGSEPQMMAFANKNTAHVPPAHMHTIINSQ